MKISIKTSGGNYLTANRGGNVGDPEGMPANSVPFHTTAMDPGPDAIFTFVPQGGAVFNLVTANGSRVEAVGGGGMGNPPELGTRPVALLTDATERNEWETFELVPVSPRQNRYALRTADGHYVSAVEYAAMRGTSVEPKNLPLTSGAFMNEEWMRFEIETAPTQSRSRSLANEAHASVPLANALIPQAASFVADMRDPLSAVRAAATDPNRKHMSPALRDQFRSLAQSSFVQQASATRKELRTIAFAFGAEGGFILGGGIAAGIAFDLSFSRYMFFESLTGSLGLTVGGTSNFRLGLYDYDVFSVNGFSDTLEIDVGLIIGGGLASVWNWWDGGGIEFAFGVGYEGSAAVTLGYTSDSGHGHV